MHEFDYSVPLFVTRVRGTRIVVTLDIVSDVLHVPRVVRMCYPMDMEHIRYNIWSDHDVRTSNASDKERY